MIRAKLTEQSETPARSLLRMSLVVLVSISTPRPHGDYSEHIMVALQIYKSCDYGLVIWFMVLP